MKKISALLTPLILVAIAFGILMWWNANKKAPSPTDSTSYPFIIEPGLSASTIGKKLEYKGFIRSQLAFRIYVQAKGLQDKIQAGDYRLQKNKPLPQLVRELATGPIAIWVTLPEGMRRTEMAAKIAGELGLGEVGKQEFIDNFLDASEGKEGFLFPDTYLFLKNTTAQSVVEKLRETFDKRVEEGIREKAKSLDLTFKELIILASVIERETRTNDERRVVAGILLKRLEIGMPLQADATLQYAVASVKCKVKSEKCNWWESVGPEDRKIKSPYNTYTNRGLPPAPIANPGLASIKAATNPEGSSYLYYLHGNDGKIRYAKTIEEHGENIRKYLQ